MAALNTRGFALLADGAVDRAAETFQQSIAIGDEQVRPHIGLAQVARLRGRTDEWNQEREFAQRGVTQLRCGGRSVEAQTLEAALQVLEDRPSSALATLSRLLEEPAPSAGWSIPIDPLFRSLRRLPEYVSISRTLAWRASSESGTPQPT